VPGDHDSQTDRTLDTPTHPPTRPPVHQVSVGYPPGINDVRYACDHLLCSDHELDWNFVSFEEPDPELKPQGKSYDEPKHTKIMRRMKRTEV